MNIQLLSLNLRRGGLEKIAVLLAHEFRQMGHWVQLSALHGPNEYQDLLIRCGLSLDLLLQGKPPYFWTAIPGHVRRLRRNWNRHNHDVLLALGGQALILARLAGIRPLVYSAQNSAGEHWLFWRPGYVLLRCLERWAFADERVRIIGCSQSVTRTYRERFRIHPNRITTILNATDVESFDLPFSSTGSRSPVILAVGTLYYQKNYPMAIRGLATLHALGVRALLRIAGEGPEKTLIARMARELGVEGYVELLGRREDIPGLMAQADCFWMTSHYEGFSLALAEAMAARLPVVATMAPGVTDAVEDGKDGLLVELNDYQALANRTIFLLNNPAHAREIADNAHEKAMKWFHPKYMAKEYLDFLLAEKWRLIP